MESLFQKIRIFRRQNHRLVQLEGFQNFRQIHAEQKERVFPVMRILERFEPVVHSLRNQKNLVCVKCELFSARPVADGALRQKGDQKIAVAAVVIPGGGVTFGKFDAVGVDGKILLFRCKEAVCPDQFPVAAVQMIFLELMPDVHQGDAFPFHSMSLSAFLYVFWLKLI